MTELSTPRLSEPPVTRHGGALMTQVLRNPRDVLSFGMGHGRTVPAPAAGEKSLLTELCGKTDQEHLNRKDNRPRRVSLHIQSGEAAQWVSKLPRSVAEIYAERHGQTLIDLGYETDQSWVARCPDNVDLSPAKA